MYHRHSDGSRSWLPAAAAVLAASIAAPARGQEPAPAIAITGGTVIASPGAAPLADAVVLVEGGRIAVVGPVAEVQIPEDAVRIDARGATVLAGFWNSHVHLATPGLMGADTLPAEILGARLEEMFGHWGFVRLVDTGSFLGNTLELRRRVRTGEVPGPTILTAGEPFAAPGGTPFYLRPLMLPEIGTEDQAADSVRARLDAGADLIKLFAASPVTIGEPPVSMPPDILAAIVRAAHGAGRLVAAHPTSREGAAAAATAGVDLLLHTTPDDGLAWDPAFARDLVARGIALTPTLDLWRWVAEEQGASPAAIDTFQSRGIGQLAAFAGAGGTILFGTDAGYTDAFDPSGEYPAMARAGMGFDATLAALTTAPASLFGLAGRTGRLEPGFDADVVVVEGDPRVDIGALARVRTAIAAGRVVFPR